MSDYINNTGNFVSAVTILRILRKTKKGERNIKDTLRNARAEFTRSRNFGMKAKTDIIVNVTSIRCRLRIPVVALPIESSRERERERETVPPFRRSRSHSRCWKERKNVRAPQGSRSIETHFAPWQFGLVLGDSFRSSFAATLRTFVNLLKCLQISYRDDFMLRCHCIPH